MILYTPLSETDIFPQIQDDYTNRHCVQYKGKRCYVKKQTDGTYQLLQLLSTDPNDFLNGNFAPGEVLK
ncbi:MAG TPA: YlzJ-like family protein [Bacillota bacterium]|nr:YlzJ-like family protein [Bacillota bacterium]